MHITLNFRLLLIIGVLLTPAAWADEFTDTIEVFKGAGASAGFFDTAYAYAVFPTIGKAGMGIGGARGTGQVFVGDQAVGRTTVTQLSVGFQFGGQAFSQIIFLKDERAFKEFTSGEFAFGANAGAVAITAGVSAGANTAGGSSAGASGGKNDAVTAGEYYKGMAVFTVAKGGLMYEASVGGQKFSYAPLAAN